MKTALSWAGLLLALALIALSVINASWMTEAPRGYMKLVAWRGVSQAFDHRGITDDTCTARKIDAPAHPFLEDTVAGIAAAARMGAQMVTVDIAPTKDGGIALFHDWTLDCRTDGHGPVRDATMAQLKALDAGYGYSADGGRTFPLRGQGVGAIPALEDALAAAPTLPLLYNFKSKDAAEADLLVAHLKAAERDPVKLGDGFQGVPAQRARILAAFPGAWTFGKDSVRACTTGYLKTGWFGAVPDACRDGTMFIPVNYAWAFAGYPNRLMKRLAATGTRAVLIGPHGRDEAGMGLDLPEQVRDVPLGWTGYVWVDDIYSVGPAARPALLRRTPPQEAALQAQLEKRRARDQ
jgi:glycerophosphoryl diester phosphodiesterase